jgi:cyclic nucleotide-binding protein
MFSVLDLFGHLSNALYTIGSGFRNILYLRWAFILAAIMEIVYDAFISDKILWTPFLWSIALIIINIYQILRVIYQKRFLNFSDDELKAFILIGDKMDVLNFKKLVRAGTWQHYAEHKNIVKENEAAEKIFLIVDGEAEVKIKGKKISTLKKGNFIGEISFLTGELPSADVVAASNTKVIGWEKVKLKKFIEKNHLLKHEINSLFSNDLIAKLHHLNRLGHIV